MQNSAESPTNIDSLKKRYSSILYKNVFFIVRTKLFQSQFLLSVFNKNTFQLIRTLNFSLQQLMNGHNIFIKKCQKKVANGF